jgi:hypothetical protein
MAINLPRALLADIESARDQGQQGIVLVMYRMAEPRGQYVRLFGKSGPKGRFVGAELTNDARRPVKVIADFAIADLLHLLPTESAKNKGAGE